MNWKEYDELHQAPRHEAEDRFVRQQQRIELDAKMDDPAERKNSNDDQN